MWDDEKKRGGSDGDVVMRFMSQAQARRLSEARHEVYDQLQAIKNSVELFRLKLQHPELLSAAVDIDKAADRIRTVLGNVSAV
jgi:hypothetical protein